MLKLIDRVPLSVLVVMAVLLGIAPIVPQPHLVEKLSMLFAGTLTRPIDIFDLFFHATPIVLLMIRLLRLRRSVQD